MPWASKKQAAWGNSPAGIKAMGKAKVEEFNKATPKGSLKKKKVKKSMEDILYG
jgi:hypothetical protein